MIRAQWISTATRTARAMGRLQVLLICALVVSMLISVVPSHAGHDIAKAATQAELVIDDSGGYPASHPSEELDCSVHPGCYAMAVMAAPELLSMRIATLVAPERFRPRASLPVAPLPHPPNLS